MPSGIDILYEGNSSLIYVNDHSNNRIQVFRYDEKIVTVIKTITITEEAGSTLTILLTTLASVMVFVYLKKRSKSKI